MTGRPAVDPIRRLLTPDALAFAAVVAAVAWATLSLLDDRSSLDLAPAAVTIVLVGVSVAARSRLGPVPSPAATPRWFVPAVAGAAVVAAAGWSIGDGLPRGLAVGTAVLVMATPAAAMIAVPLAASLGARRATTIGVRFGDLSAVRATAAIDTLVLAKDGTVTSGDLRVLAVEPVDPDHDRNLRWFAGALAKASDDRAARAVAGLAARGRLTDVEVIEGVGVRGSVDRHPVRLGEPSWIGFVPAPTIWTTLGVEVDGRTIGTVILADEVRPGVAHGVHRLRELGLDLVLVSDDTDERTRHVAAEAGVATVHTSDDVETVVRDLTATGRRVSTVGTPPVDGAVLTITDGGLPTSAHGPSIATDDCSPTRVADAIELGRRTTRLIGRARTTATALGAAGAVVGATGLAGPVVIAVASVAIWLAVAAVAGSS